MERSTIKKATKTERRVAREINMRNGLIFNKSYFGEKKRLGLKIIKRKIVN